MTNNHSKNHALISLTDLIKKYLDSCYVLCGVFFDLQQAFDTINQEILLVKLDFNGIRGLSNSWLKSFLKNGKQYVNLPGHSSSVKTVSCGVPQDSTLGPLLFLQYINDLQSLFFQNQLFTILQMKLIFYFSAKNLGTTDSVINYDLKLLVQWLRSNKLPLHETKTDLIIFRSLWNHLPGEPEFRINNYKLKLHSHVKYLGILIDEALYWKKQIDDICIN